MSDMRFDTEKMVERLEDAGVPPAQARAQVSLLMNSILTAEESIIERCATKQEVADNVALIKAEFEKQRSHFDNEFEQLRLHVDEKLEKQRLYVDAELQKQRLHFEAELEKLRLDFRARLSNTKSDLILLVVTVGILQMGLITALVLKLVPSPTG